MTATAYNALSNRNLRAGKYSFLDLLRRVRATQHQRQQLHDLDSAALLDIGLSRAQADAEASRPIWDVPVNWRR